MAHRLPGPQTVLIVRLLTLLALIIERLYRLRHVHRGDHGVLSAMQLHDSQVECRYGRRRRPKLPGVVEMR